MYFRVLVCSQWADIQAMNWVTLPLVSSLLKMSANWIEGVGCRTEDAIIRRATLNDCHCHVMLPFRSWCRCFAETPHLSLMLCYAPQRCCLRNAAQKLGCCHTLSNSGLIDGNVCAAMKAAWWRPEHNYMEIRPELIACILLITLDICQCWF